MNKTTGECRLHKMSIRCHPLLGWPWALKSGFSFLLFFPFGILKVFLLKLDGTEKADFDSTLGMTSKVSLLRNATLANHSLLSQVGAASCPTENTFRILYHDERFLFSCVILSHTLILAASTSSSVKWGWETRSILALPL